MPFPIALLLGISLGICFTAAAPAESCKCWEGYEAQEGPDGVACVGIMLLHTLPCNEPQPPNCKCSGNVTGILKDETGIWCSTYAAGKEIKRWACENKDQWAKFYEENPDYKQ